MNVPQQGERIFLQMQRLHQFRVEIRDKQPPDVVISGGRSRRFTTYEIIESVPIVVVKKDQSREVFDRMKLFNGILRACEKRPVSTEEIEKAVDEIELTIQNSLDREVTSIQIGELAMDKLKDIDDVAYVRFASVYRQFKDINTFMDELSKILTNK